MLGNAKISIFWRNESKIRNFQQREFWAKREKKIDCKFSIKIFQSADFDSVGRIRGNKLIFNFGLSICHGLFCVQWFDVSSCVCFVDIGRIFFSISLNFLLMWWFSPGTPVSSTNKTDCDDITEILLKVALNTLNLNLRTPYYLIHSCLPLKQNFLVVYLLINNMNIAKDCINSQIFNS